MNIVIRAGILLIITTLSVSSETWKDDVRGWYIGIDEKIGNDCYMHRSFENGTQLRIILDSEYAALFFLIGNRNWRSLEIGELYPIEIQFDSRTPWAGDGNAFAWDGGINGLILNIEEGEAFDFIEELQQMQNVTVRYNGDVIANLSLKGSKAAFNEVINCFFTVYEVNQNTVSDPFSSN